MAHPIESAAATAPIPPAIAPDSPKAIWVPRPGMPWHWLLDHGIDLNDPKDMGLVDAHGAAIAGAVPEMYDIDGFLNGRDLSCHVKTATGGCATGDNDAVAALHARGKRVVCYISAGAVETYRPDAYRFPQAVIGHPHVGWDGSNWLDIRQQAVLLPIIEARIAMCASKGFDAVEPDEINGYSNDTGFPLTATDQISYNRAVASLAHRYGLSVALKSDGEQAPQLVNDFDWVLDEQCYELSSCRQLDPFTATGKAVFDAEYSVPPQDFCADANRRNWSAASFPLNLDGGRTPCR